MVSNRKTIYRLIVIVNTYSLTALEKQQGWSSQSFCHWKVSPEWIPIQQQQYMHVTAFRVTMYLFLHYLTWFLQMPCERSLIISQVRQVDTFKVKNDFMLEEAVISIFSNLNSVFFSLHYTGLLLFYALLNIQFLAKIRDLWPAQCCKTTTNSICSQHHLLSSPIRKVLETIRMPLINSTESLGVEIYADLPCRSIYLYICHEFLSASQTFIKAREIFSPTFLHWA